MSRLPFLKLAAVLLLLSTTVLKASGQSEEEANEGPEPEQIINAWKLGDFYTTEKPAGIDTFLTSFQVHNPVFSHSISASFLGNAGLASKSNIFKKRFTRNNDLIFLDPFKLYLHHPDKAVFYDTRRPFSKLDFTTGGPSDENEKNFGVLHTQNVTPDFNLGFRYFNINSEGQYREQEVRTNAITLFSNYFADRYSLHALLNLNSVNNNESGGLEDDGSLADMQLSTTDLPVRLNNVINIVRNNHFFVSQSFTPFETGIEDEDDIFSIEQIKLFHIFHYENLRRTYEDPAPSPGFYENFFINSSRTLDSTAYRNISNSLIAELPGIQTRSFSFSLKGGIKNEMVKYSYSMPQDTIVTYLGEGETDTTFISRAGSSHHNNALVVTGKSSISDRLELTGSANLYFSGYKQGEYSISATALLNLLEGRNRSLLKLFIEQKETKPSVFLNSYSSNHFMWENDFRHSGQSTVGGSFSMPERELEAGVQMAVLNNHIYMDRSANPAQYSSAFPVVTAWLKKDLNLWRFNFRNKIYYQTSGNQSVLPLPAISIYSSIFYEHFFLDGMLQAQAGFDIYYNTPFYAYAYQPATAQFYIQEEKMLGNYPYFDFFISFQHKNRFRMFLKGEHLNAGFLGPQYFTVLHHPMNRQMFKLGVSWTFYD